MYRENDLDPRDEEIRRLRQQVEELEEAFEGLIEYQPDRTRCPICGEKAEQHLDSEKIVCRVVPATTTGFFRKKRVPAHVVRKHNQCEAEWRERMPPHE